MLTRLLNGKYTCIRRINSERNSLEKIEVNNEKINCTYLSDQLACSKEKNLCCLVWKQAYESSIALTSPKCTIEKPC